ncbi:hypothetical protein PRZ48_010140 [Zasmidium cellare]|uniref:Aminoglycoside phosphotransferase domain-containing protein n=1 Tax=Zasmidium cellare TaxID=395010 RepID=A0ABR0EDP9_ZASCE|nr:hypothetical protein PRZ48_010140 [Zasmidium cellare]
MAKHNSSGDSPSTAWLAGCQVSEHQTSDLPVPDDLPTSYLTDEDRIVAACSAPDRQLLSDPEIGSLIVRYSESYVVKVGNVSASEARNQLLAHQILDPSIVRVPEVYHYFTRDDEGYLVMEYIRGVPCSSQVSQEDVEKIAAATRHLWSYQSNLATQAPGPIGGGMTRGMLWENEEIEIEDLQDLEKYWNDRLLGQMEPVHFESSHISFVHCDIAPRNIIWDKDGIPVLLDWAHAGIYPRSFERAALHLNTQQGTEVDFTDSVAELLPLSEEEGPQIQKVLLGWFNGHRFYMLRHELTLEPFAQQRTSAPTSARHFYSSALTSRTIAPATILSPSPVATIMPHAVPVEIDEDLIVEACEKYDLLSDFDSSYPREKQDGVIRYSANAVVKYGAHVTAHEARNQRHAYRVLDPSIVRVPEVYHYFERQNGRFQIGYIVMELIAGQRCENLPASNKLHKIVNVVEHLASQHGNAPGPVGGGKSDGVLWDWAEEEIKSVAELEKHFNDRLFDKYGGVWDKRYWRGIKLEPLRFKESELVLVHGAICPQNILWCRDGRPALLDWSIAGFYPKTFERASMEWNIGRGDYLAYIDAMVELMPLQEHEDDEIQKLQHAARNSDRYGLYPDRPENFWLPPPHQAKGEPPYHDEDDS